jgi:RNA polymerase sigma-70 factor (ECF subfamily)
VADDVVAETFCTASRERRRYDLARPDARPWLWRIATNLMKRHHRSETRLYRALVRTGVDAVVDGHEDRVAERLGARETNRHLVRASPSPRGSCSSQGMAPIGRAGTRRPSASCSRPRT